MATADSPDYGPRHRAGAPQPAPHTASLPSVPQVAPPTTGPPTSASARPQWAPQTSAGTRWTPETPEAEQPSLGELVKNASTHLSTLVRGEIELAKSEITVSVKKGAQGAVFFGAAAVVLVFSLVFLLIALAEGLVALGLYRWLAYLIVWFLLVLVAGVAGLIGYRRVKRIRKPERTLETLKDSKSLLKRGPATSTS